MGLVEGILQDVIGEVAFVLFEVRKDLLGEFFSGDGHGSSAWGERRFDSGVGGCRGEIYFFAVDGDAALRVLGILCRQRETDRFAVDGEHTFDLSLRDGGFRGRIFAGVGVGIVVDGVEAAKEEAADVSESGSAARRNASAGEKFVEGCEGIVDALGIQEAGSVVDQRVSEVLVVVELGGGVFGAEG